MANSSFQKNKSISTPVTVPNGGTGRISLTDKNIILGAGTGDVGFVAPGVSEEILISDGISWKSGSSVPPDASISYSKLGTDMIGISTVSSVDIDWSTSSIFTKTITSNTSFTFSNYQLNKIITLVIKGNYVVSLPKSVSKISGLYDGLTTNYITLHCTKVTAPQEVWAVINKKFYLSPVGYFAGGNNGAAVVTTDRITFSTGVTTASTASNLSQARGELAGVSDTSNYGYFAGGSSGAVVATTDRITFSTGVTAANTASNLSQARTNLTGISDRSTYGYFAGGESSNVTTVTDRVIFSTGVTAVNTVSSISIAKRLISGVSDGSTYGYFAGGLTDTGGTSYSLSADRITFSTGVTAANTASNLSLSRYGLAGVSDNFTYGYFAGGSSSVLVSTADRITFSTGVTAANTVSNLSSTRRYVSGTSDGLQYGYFVGGDSSVIADKIIFSTGVTAANTVSNLSQARRSTSGISNYSV